MKNPHWFKVHAAIDKTDLGFFDEAIKSKVSSIMIGHTMVSGELNSHGKQSTVSKNIIDELRKKFDGLIITDAIGMLGLRSSYFFDSSRMYIDLIKAGNDLILDTFYLSSGFKRVRNGISEIESAVRRGEITESRINSSVKRILKIKGYNFN